MSSIQIFYDLGVTVGLLGAHHAEDHNPFKENRRPPLKDTAKVACQFTGANVLVLGVEHEPGRVIGLMQHERIAMRLTEKPPHQYAYCLQQPCCGVFITEHAMRTMDVRTILLPVCDHPVIGVQLADEEGGVLGFGALRATPDRLCGDGSVIAALFEHLGQHNGLLEQTRRICFHLSAGRGPCCMQDNVKTSVHVADKKLRGEGFDGFAVRDFVTNGGFNMLAVLTAEIHRWTYTQKSEFTVNARDRDCTVCCAEHEGMPYYSAEFDRHNLAVFSSELKIPERPRW